MMVARVARYDCTQLLFSAQGIMQAKQAFAVHVFYSMSMPVMSKTQIDITTSLNMR